MKQRKKQKPLGIKSKRHEVPICRHPHRLATLHLATVHSFSPISICWTEQRGVRQRCGLFCHVFYCLRLGHKKGCILAKALNAPFVCDFFFCSLLRLAIRANRYLALRLWLDRQKYNAYDKIVVAYTSMYTVYGFNADF